MPYEWGPQHIRDVQWRSRNREKSATASLNVERGKVPRWGQIVMSFSKSIAHGDLARGFWRSRDFF